MKIKLPSMKWKPDKFSVGILLLWNQILQSTSTSANIIKQIQQSWSYIGIITWSLVNFHDNDIALYKLISKTITRVKKRNDRLPCPSNTFKCVPGYLSVYYHYANRVNLVKVDQIVIAFRTDPLYINSRSH